MRLFRSFAVLGSLLAAWVSPAPGQPQCDAARAHFPAGFRDCRGIVRNVTGELAAGLVLLWNPARQAGVVAQESSELTENQLALVVAKREPGGGMRVYPVAIPVGTLVMLELLTSDVREVSVEPDGVLIEAIGEKSQKPVHWWLRWPDDGDAEVTFQRWKAYRFDRVVSHDGSTYYVGLNGSNRVVARYTGATGFVIAAPAIAKQILASLHLRAHTFGVPPGMESEPPPETEYWHPMEARYRLVVKAPGGAVCEADIDPLEQVSEFPGQFWRRASGGVREYSLHRGTVEEYRRFQAESGASEREHMNESQLIALVGPVQVEDSRIWYGRAFYGGEGYAGIGGFGCLDCESGEFKELFPKPATPYTTTALLVEPDAIWLALANNGAYGMAAGGLLRWNRSDESTQHFPKAPVAFALVRDKRDLLVPHQSGISVLRDGEFVHYAIREMPSGEARMIRLVTP